MSEVTWGQLAKAVADYTKVSEEIDADILTHNEDPSSHGQANEGLYVHRVAAILDHLDQAVTNPKILAIARPYTAIVDAEGEGDYTDIQDAIDYVNGLDIGGGTILIRPGTYTLTADLTLYSDITLKGVKTSECILDFDNNLKYIKITGDTAVYNTGTVSITGGTYVVTGAGTSWLANAAAGEFIKLNGVLYEIESVDLDTQITLKTRFGGEYNSALDLSGASYEIAAYKQNIVIDNLWITQGGIEEGVTGEGAIHGEFVKELIIKDCKVDKARSRGIKIEHGYNCIIDSPQISDNTDAGFEGNYLSYSIITGAISNNASTEGIWLASTCDNNIIFNNDCCHNNNGGISIAGDNNVIIGNHANYNNNDGIFANGDKNTIIGNIACNNAVLNGIRTTGVNNIIKGNICHDNADDGIEVQAADYCVVIGNECNDNAGDGIKLAGSATPTDVSYSTVHGNICNGNTGYGVNNNHANNTKNIIGLNQLLGNIAGAYNDSGTDTEIGHNIDN